MKPETKPSVIHEPKLVEPARFIRHLAEGPTSQRIETFLNKKKHAQTACEMLIARAKKAQASSPIYVRCDELQSSKKNELYSESTANGGIQIVDQAYFRATEGRFRLRRVKDLKGILPRALEGLPSEKTFVVVENLGVAASVFRTGFMPYDPFTYVKNGKNAGILVELYQLLSRPPGIEFTLDEFGINKALNLLPPDRSAQSSAVIDHGQEDGQFSLDCLLGVFDSPGRAENRHGVFLFPTHLISLVGVTHKKSRIHTLNDVMENPDVKVYCVNCEAGEEFVCRALGMSPSAPPRVNRMDSKNVGEVLEFLKDDPNRIAIIDGVSAHTYLRRNPHLDAKKGGALVVGLKQLTWFACGMLIRKGEVADRVLKEWKSNFPSARMMLWQDSEKNLLEQLALYSPGKPADDVVRPVLYPRQGPYSS